MQNRCNSAQLYYFRNWTKKSCTRQCNKNNMLLYHLCRVFEVMPELKTKFPGKVDIEQLKSTRTLYGHNKILMKSIENAVASLDDNESFVTYLVELGRRHQVRPLKAQYLEVSFPCLTENQVIKFFEDNKRINRNISLWSVKYCSL